MATRHRVALLALAVTLWTATALVDPTLGHVDPEEGVNAAQAVAFARLPPTDLFRLQYMPVCGGCTVDALLAAPAFAVLGPTTLAWKLALLPWLVVLAGATLWAVDRRWGPRWSALAALALAAPPALAADLTFRGWGNHHEAATLALASLLLGWAAEATGVAFVAGLLATLALFTSWSALPFAAVAAGVGLASERRAPWAVGALLGLLPWVAETALAGAGWTDIAGQGRVLARGLPLRVRAAELQAPERLSYLLAGGGSGPWTWAPLTGVVLAGAGAGIGVDRLGRALLVGAGLWVAGVLLGPGELGGLAGAQVFNARYAAGLSWSVALLVVAGARGWVSRGSPRLAALVVLLWLPWTWEAAVARRLEPDLRPLLTTEAPAWTWFRRYVLTRPGVPPLACPAGDATCRALEAYRAGAAPASSTDGETPAHAAGRGRAYVGALEPVDRRALLTGDGLARLAADLRSTDAVAEAVAVAAPSVPGDLTCPSGLPPELADAFGWGVATALLPRFHVEAARPPCDDADVAAGWARGLGQVSALRWGVATRPVGFDGWPAAWREGFERGAGEVSTSGWVGWTPTP